MLRRSNVHHPLSLRRVHSFASLKGREGRLAPCYDAGALPLAHGRLVIIPDSAQTPHPRIFFGWWIVAGTWGLQAIQGSLLFLSFGAYFTQLEATFGWSRTALSGAFSLSRVESGLLGPLHGYWVDRYGPRLVLQVGTVIFGIGFFMLSRIDTLWQFYVAFLVIAIGASLAGFLTLNTALANWFIRRRARAMSIAQTGLGAAGIFAVGVAWLLETYGWRTTFVIAGVLILVIGLPLSTLFHHRPEDVGLLPDGRLPEDDLRQVGDNTATRYLSDEVDFTLREAMRDRSFWFISLGHGAALFVVAGLQAHLVLHLQDLGWTLTGAAAIIPLLTLTSVVGQLAAGAFGDRYSKRMIAAVAMLGHAAAMFLLSFSDASPAIVAAAIVHGLAWGARGPLMTAIRAEYYGRRNFAKIMGTSSLIVQLGTVIGPLFAGYVFDQTGSYQLAFLTLGSLTGASSIFFVLARRPALPQRLRAAAEARELT